MKKICILLALILTFTGLCITASAEAPELKIGYLCQTQDYEFHNNALLGTIKACEDMGREYNYTSIDTVAISRAILTDIKNCKLDTVAKFLRLGDFNHHIIAFIAEE